MSASFRIAIAGAGAIGGWLGARLAAQGHTVSLLARGAHLAAIRRDGLRLESKGETFVAKGPASDDPRDLGPQDYVILGFKNTAMPAAAPTLAPMLGPDTAVVSVMNGVPWWFFARTGSPFAGRRIESVDPDGTIGAALAPERIVGGVVNGSFALAAPGVARHVSGGLAEIGELDGSRSPRLDRLAQALEAAGIPTRVSTDVRRTVWMKLLGNVVFNTTGALTGATADRIIDDPGMRRLCTQAMQEAIDLGRALGVQLEVDIDERISSTRALGAIKASTLQDVEAGRPLEIDALIGAPVELAGWVNRPVPTLTAIETLLRMRASVLGLLPARGGRP